MTRPAVTAESLTDEDFRAFSKLLRAEMDGLDGREWQEREDLREDCRRGRVHNDLGSKIRIAAAINARNGGGR